MKHLNRGVTIWALAAFLLAGGQAFAQAGSKPAAQKPKTQEKQAVQLSDQDLNLRAYIELLRSDVKAEATEIVAEVMQLNDADAAKFWPIYREFELGLSKIGDEKMALIKKYADNYENMSDEVADQLAQGVFKLEQERQDLKMKYYERIKNALTAKTAARFFQVLNQILMLTDLQVASSLPVIK
jgi:hypothetical protein